ncbi:hypothetical protein GOBAR_DD11861 [Gossypium barbadense]|nr:hypothetical protein GOBAR_DD11861 [Gossypium barbadense]
MAISQCFCFQLSASVIVPGWSKPPMGQLNCNIDAVVFEGEGGTGWGELVQDVEGSFVMLNFDFVMAKIAIYMTEVVAIKEALCCCEISTLMMFLWRRLFSILAFFYKSNH